MRRLTLLLAGAVALVALMASANAAGTTQIAGIQSVFSTDLPVPECSEATANVVYEMAGSLVGCWYTDTVEEKLNPSGTYQATGTEHFVGCLNGTTCGTFSTTFTFTAKFVIPTFEEIHGRCHHPIVGGTGGFTGATGVLTFKDDVTNGTAPYKGHITLR